MACESDKIILTKIGKLNMQIRHMKVMPFLHLHKSTNWHLKTQ